MAALFCFTQTVEQLAQPNLVAECGQGPWLGVRRPRRYRRAGRLCRPRPRSLASRQIPTHHPATLSCSPAAPQEGGAIGDFAQCIAMLIGAGTDGLFVQGERVGPATVREQEQRLMPGQMAEEPGSIRIVGQPSAQEV